jgi:hypothetical protein
MIVKGLDLLVLVLVKYQAKKPFLTMSKAMNCCALTRSCINRKPEKRRRRVK